MYPATAIEDKGKIWCMQVSIGAWERAYVSNSSYSVELTQFVIPSLPIHRVFSSAHILNLSIWCIKHSSEQNHKNYDSVFSNNHIKRDKS